MSAGSIWWGQIGNSLRLLTKITNDLKDCRSAILQIPAAFPWRQDFYEAVDLRRASFGGERRLMRLPWEEGGDPGDFVLTELCSARVRADYFPMQTYAEYLGSREDLVLNDYYVWVTGIRTKRDIANWAEFVTRYERHARDLARRAVFLLEYSGPELEPTGMEMTVYEVESYDCRVFCLEAAAELDNTTLRNYQAELARTIGGNDPELCAALLRTGPSLLTDPVRTACAVSSGQRASDGRAFPVLTEKQITAAAWETAIVLFFPLLERIRSEFIERNQDELRKRLPIRDADGNQIWEPQDLEIGPLNHVIARGDRGFLPEDVNRLRLCRKVRNILAHNKQLSYQDICSLHQAEQTLTAG